MLPRAGRIRLFPQQFRHAQMALGQVQGVPVLRGQLLQQAGLVLAGGGVQAQRHQVGRAAVQECRPRLRIVAQRDERGETSQDRRDVRELVFVAGGQILQPFLLKAPFSHGGLLAPIPVRGSNLLRRSSRIGKTHAGQGQRDALRQWLVPTEFSHVLHNDDRFRCYAGMMAAAPIAVARG